MKKLAVIGAAVGLIVGLAGCSTTVGQTPTENGVYVENSYGGGSVTVVEIPDGERTVTCAVIVGYSKGGISCDWANAK